MKFLKVLLYCSLWFLFACWFTLLGVILLYIWETRVIDQNYEVPTITLNVWTWDRSINQFPMIGKIDLSSNKFEWNSFDETIFNCSNTDNLIVKVSADNIIGSGWNIYRLRFYYYGVDDPNRILEYKDTTFSTTPYVYFNLPKIAWVYRFWVIFYDDNWWFINSEDILWKWPSFFIPYSCYPMVTLKVDSNNVKVWDTVTFHVDSNVSSNNENFEKERIFYYDFTGDWKRDVITKQNTVTYQFMESYEDWIVPRVGVVYRKILKMMEWDRIYINS